MVRSLRHVFLTVLCIRRFRALLEIPLAIILLNQDCMGVRISFFAQSSWRLLPFHPLPMGVSF